MRKKQLVASALVAIVALTSVPVLAATGTKTATLNNAQVSFNGAPAQTIQCYNIDGNNYVRARDITNNLNMYVMQIQNGNTGILIDPLSPAEAVKPSEKLTKQTAQVNVQKGQLIYDAMPYEAECFMLDNRFYFKLNDFKNASDSSLQVSLDLIDIIAKQDYVDGPYDDVYHGIDVKWDAVSRVIHVNKVDTDMQKIFDDIRAGNPSKSQTDNSQNQTTNKSEVDKTTETSDKSSQNKLTSAPKVGTILADILVDDSKGAYLDSAMTQPNKENFTEIYRNIYKKPEMIGQCTWYAAGRFQEVNGDVAYNNDYRNAKTVKEWVNNAASDKCPDLDGITDSNKIQAGCIAVWEGHAAFVEWVDYDNSGNPQYVYYTEANSNHRSNGLTPGVYYPDFDCKVKKASFSEFINGIGQEFVGYVVVK